VEILNPDELNLILNDCLSMIEECVEKTGGVLAEFQGRLLCAHWGTLSTTGNNAHDALNCARSALMIRVAFHEINQKYAEEGKAPLRYMCAVANGTIIAGTVKPSLKEHYVLLGEPPALAEKLTELNGESADILISEQTQRLLQQYVITEKIEDENVFALINLRSKRQEVQPFPRNLADVQSLIIEP
jgi:class 3 adenylate cyclase